MYKLAKSNAVFEHELMIIDEVFMFKDYEIKAVLRAMKRTEFRTRLIMFGDPF
jgi:hypothetical protein